MFENIQTSLHISFQDRKIRDRWSARFDASDVNRSCSSRHRVEDRIIREDVACFTGNSTHVNMVSALENVLKKFLGVLL